MNILFFLKIKTITFQKKFEKNFIIKLVLKIHFFIGNIFQKKKMMKHVVLLLSLVYLFQFFTPDRYLQREVADPIVNIYLPVIIHFQIVLQLFISSSRIGYQVPISFRSFITKVKEINPQLAKNPLCFWNTSFFQSWFEY